MILSGFVCFSCATRLCLSVLHLTCTAWEETSALWPRSSITASYGNNSHFSRSYFPFYSLSLHNLAFTYYACFQRRMSSDVSPSLLNWMTSMMTMRLQYVLEHLPITTEQIQNYIVYTQVNANTASVALWLDSILILQNSNKGVWHRHIHNMGQGLEVDRPSPHPPCCV